MGEPVQACVRGLVLKEGALALLFTHCVAVPNSEQRVCGFGVAVLQMLPLVLVLPVNTEFELVDKSYNAWGTLFLAIRLQLSNDVLPALGGSKHASTSSSSSHGLCAVQGMTSFQKMSVDFAIPPVLGVLMLLSFLVLHVSHIVGGTTTTTSGRC